MNICDLVVCRSGAMTITEISEVGKPAIFIPYPYATEKSSGIQCKSIGKM